MTDEEAFQAALDADPTDWQCRLVFADWLQDRDDPRAEGYRALGRLRKRPQNAPNAAPVEWFMGDMDQEYYGRRPKSEEYLHTQLPHEWWCLVEGGRPWDDVRIPPRWRHYETRREVDDAAALAFSKLPADRRAELLAHQEALTR